MPNTTLLTNARLCVSSHLISGEDLLVSPITGAIIDRRAAIEPYDEVVVDMRNRIIAPGFLELQTNGMHGFHFTHFTDEESYARKIEEVGTWLVSQGVTGFWGTVPTVESREFKKILPALYPRDIPGGASLLGAHAEGPYLDFRKNGAHNSALFHPPSTPPEEVYGDVAKNNETLKLVTLAPELPGSTHVVSNLVRKGIRVSLGHSSASFEDGLAALQAGASCLTHTLNAMTPLHHRDPGLAGLITAPPPASPYFSIIADGNHLHPSIASLLFRANPQKCILITDSVELAGLPDATYPGHAQVPFNQTKIGSRVVIEGTDTLIGGCASLGQCVWNLNRWSGCGVAEAVRCATENVARFMGVGDRGCLEVGRRADLVVLDEEGGVVETWVKGVKVWERS